MKTKKIIALILALFCAVLCFTACGTPKEEKSDGKIKVVTTIFPPYDYTRQIGKDNVDVSMLLKPGMESHNFDPTPQDIIKIQEADLFIYVGGESDAWVKDILESGDKKPQKSLAIMDVVEKVAEETVEGMTAEKEEREEDSDEIEYDEHVWTSPKNAEIIANSIMKALCEIDQKNKDDYIKAGNDYSLQLKELDKAYKEVVDNAKLHTIIFADRFPFRYLADEFGLSYFAAFPGCSAETEPSAATVSFLIDKVKEMKIPVVFTIEFSNGKIADTICEATGAKRLEMHSCHNLSSEMFESGETYISLMKKNLNNLKEALS